MKNKIPNSFLLLLVFCAQATAALPSDTVSAQGGYRVDEPGTITFTVGVKIKGKIEKPQVMIFLPKEKPYYRPVTFSYSFKEDILEPIPFEPLLKP